MREYECVYIANPDLTDQQITEINNRIKTIVEKDDGRFFYARSMGKRRLSYRIAKKTKGIYYCVDFASGGRTVSELERMYRLNEDILRFLTVVKADSVDIDARMAEIAARGEDRPQVATTEGGEGEAGPCEFKASVNNGDEENSGEPVGRARGDFDGEKKE